MWASKLTLQEKLDSSAPLARAGLLTTTATAAGGRATPSLARVGHVERRLRRVDYSVNHPWPSKIGCSRLGISIHRSRPPEGGLKSLLQSPGKGYCLGVEVAGFAAGWPPVWPRAWLAPPLDLLDRPA